MNLTIKNLGRDNISYDSADFKVQDATGAQEGSIAASLYDQIKVGSLAQNKSVTGSLAFKVSAGKEATLHYQPRDRQGAIINLADQ